MLKIIKGSFTSGAHERIAEEIRSLIAKGEHSYLLVPEQHTLSLEKEMSEILPPTAPLYFEPTNFTRFANTVFRALGGIANEHSDRTRRALVMWDTLSSLSKNDELKILRVKNGVNAGLVNKAISALNEAESFGAGSELLENAAELLAKKNAQIGRASCRERVFV